ncbi:hypothetical protein EVAR_99089_1 [Eumeta japonica]|uniref:Uncharacterized protein n=1 Tax=Eumeta variegata TaxID=151549 RepID=A0A4C1ZNR4_EUMVA|nr:hypothetical protein EVAR_99089_1 [Eumeta japonica]
MCAAREPSFTSYLGRGQTQYRTQVLILSILGRGGGRGGGVHKNAAIRPERAGRRLRRPGFSPYALRMAIVTSQPDRSRARIETQNNLECIKCNKYYRVSIVKKITQFYRGVGWWPTDGGHLPYSALTVRQILLDNSHNRKKSFHKQEVPVKYLFLLGQYRALWEGGKVKDGLFIISTALTRDCRHDAPPRPAPARCSHLTSFNQSPCWTLESFRNYTLFHARRHL